MGLCRSALGSIPVSTWITAAAFATTLLAGAGKFYANDQVQAYDIALLRQSMVQDRADREEILRLLADIRERLVRLETQISTPPPAPRGP